MGKLTNGKWFWLFGIGVASDQFVFRSSFVIG
jgi:hypothetical protein